MKTCLFVCLLSTLGPNSRLNLFLQYFGEVERQNNQVSPRFKPLSVLGNWASGVQTVQRKDKSTKRQNNSEKYTDKEGGNEKGNI